MPTGQIIALKKFAPFSPSHSTQKIFSLEFKWRELDSIGASTMVQLLSDLVHKPFRNRKSEGPSLMRRSECYHCPAPYKRSCTVGTFMDSGLGLICYYCTLPSKVILWLSCPTMYTRHCSFLKSHIFNILLYNIRT
jgi:hypothetical protein